MRGDFQSWVGLLRHCYWYFPIVPFVVDSVKRGHLIVFGNLFINCVIWRLPKLVRWLLRIVVIFGQRRSEPLLISFNLVFFHFMGVELLILLIIIFSLIPFVPSLVESRQVLHKGVCWWVMSFDVSFRAHVLGFLDCLLV